MYNLISAGTLLSYTNYNVVNMSNLYNFIISVLKTSLEEDRPAIIESIKINLGMTFFSGFKSYVTKKYRHDHEFFILVSS